MAEIIVVVPTIRKENVLQFLQGWKEEFGGNRSRVILVEDNPQKTFDVGCDFVAHYSWEDIDSELGKDSWIIPRRTDCVRSYGYWKAYQASPDFIVTLDDDCFPVEDGFFDTHRKRLGRGRDERWVSSGEGLRPRGMPYYNTATEAECVLNHGLWTKVPDYDAATQLVNVRLGREFVPVDRTIPVGKYFPMCGMNLSFRPKIIPAFYFLLMGKDYPFDRLGDIWSGVILKKICDHLGCIINSGVPHVEHRRASNVWRNLQKEAPGMEMNEAFWSAVDSIVLTKSTFKECYLQIAEGLNLRGEYWDRLRLAMKIWVELF